MPQPKRILLVEDDPNDTELIITIIAEKNLANEVEAVRDDKEALDYLTCSGQFDGRTDGNPAVILLYLKLPRMGGLEVLKCIKADEKLKVIPVVILTSSSEYRDIIEGYKLGANGYVVKPVNFSQFVNVIKEIAAFWAITNEPFPRNVLKPRQS